MKNTVATFFLLMFGFFAGTALTAAPILEKNRLPSTPVFLDLYVTALSVDKYGNITTSIRPDELKSFGYALGDIVSISAGNYRAEAPIVNTYSDVDNGNALVRLNEEAVALAINHGNMSERTGIVEGTPIRITMSEVGAYRAEFEIRHLVKSENRTDYASDAIFGNFRNVHSAGIAPNIVYRSSHPALGDARAPFSAKLAEAAGINTIINLADSDEELLNNAATSLWYQEMVDSGNVVNLNMGVDIKSPDFPGKLLKGLQFMAARPGPYLIHCNEGKDRAGILSALLEALMGANIADIKADYMLSFENYYGVQKNEARYDLISHIIVDNLTLLNANIPVTDANVQKAVEQYLQGAVGLSAAELNALKAKLSKL
ncbi:hypothetical protein FACS1894172_11980 [Spirochaetia bacterium]|nr:hypothetical protein FACS1894164_01750 [Spirochaetia bacterium]GHU33449.1 hypothetical protein FACS1894172_11980 [Spirochaetia bacterium]